MFLLLQDVNELLLGESAQMRGSLSLLPFTMQGLALAQTASSPYRPTSNTPVLARYTPATLSCLQPPTLQHTRLFYTQVFSQAFDLDLFHLLHLALSCGFLYILQCQANGYHLYDTFPDFCRLALLFFLSPSKISVNFSHVHVSQNDCVYICIFTVSSLQA